MVVSTSRTGRVRPDDLGGVGEQQVPPHHSHAPAVPAAPSGNDSTTSGARLRFGHPTLLRLQVTSQACPSGPVTPSRSPRGGFPWLHYRYHWASLSLASCASLVASHRIAEAGWEQGGSDASLSHR